MAEDIKCPKCESENVSDGHDCDDCNGFGYTDSDGEDECLDCSGDGFISELICDECGWTWT